MKKNSLKLAIILLFLAGSVLCCKKDNEDLLSKTTWKLIGFVNVVYEEIKEVEPNSDICYILTFNMDKTFSGYSSTNELRGNYDINYTTSYINFYQIGGTEINELFDGKLYIESLSKVDFFSLQENELKLYYNNKQNYLLYKSWKL